MSPNNPNPTVTAPADKPQIALLIGQLDHGGTEKQLLLMLKYIDRINFDYHLLVFSPLVQLDIFSQLKEWGIQITILPETCRSIIPRLWFVFRWLRRIKPQVVHSWSWHINPYAGIGGWLAGAPVRMGSLRGSMFAPNLKVLPFHFRWMAAFAVQSQVVNSAALRTELIDQGYPARRVILLANCIELASYQSGKISMADLSELGIEPHHRVVGIVANTRPQKNHEMFIQGMIPIVRRHSDVRALIVGQADPDRQAKLEALIDQAGMNGRIILAGFRRDIPALLRRMEIVCLTSTPYCEGLPNALMEAMAAAKPIVATRVGGVPELVESDHNGLLVDSNDVEAFSEQVEYLLTEPNVAEKMGQAGRMKIINEFDCNCLAAKLLEHYGFDARGV